MIAAGALFGLLGIRLKSLTALEPYDLKGKA